MEIHLHQDIFSENKSFYLNSFACSRNCNFVIKLILIWKQKKNAEKDFCRVPALSFSPVTLILICNL